MSRLDSDVFVQDGYNSRAPFSGFLPGVAGINGSPLWCLYVNRGQCVASFGADERDGAMMEYSPAAIAYEDTARKGFRSFVSAEGLAFEPFSPHDPEQEQELRTHCPRYASCYWQSKPMPYTTRPTDEPKLQSGNP